VEVDRVLPRPRRHRRHRQARHPAGRWCRLSSARALPHGGRGLQAVSAGEGSDDDPSSSRRDGHFKAGGRERCGGSGRWQPWDRRPRPIDAGGGRPRHYHGISRRDAGRKY
jgi:hypothetical protein